MSGRQLLTFSRRPRKASEQVGASPSCSSPAVPGGDGENRGVSTAPEAPAAKSGAARRALHAVAQPVDQMTYLQSYFDEVDSFELSVETPTPPGHGGVAPEGASSVCKSHAMAYGLSRRTAKLAAAPGSALLSAAEAAQSPLKIKLPKTLRADEGPNAPAREPAPGCPGPAPSAGMAVQTAHLAAPDGQQCVHGLQPRIAAAGGVFSRLSLGIVDAFQWVRAKSHALAGDAPSNIADTPLRRQSMEHPHSTRDCASRGTCGYSSCIDASSKLGACALTGASVLDEGLANDLRQKLDIAADDSSAVGPQELSPLQKLLLVCGQEADAALVPDMDGLLEQHVDLSGVAKIGEGTFGEAYKAGNFVLKIVPMEGQLKVNGEAQKKAEEILAEVTVTLTLSGLRRGPELDDGHARNFTPGLVETFGVGVCRGAYSMALQRAWHEWDALHSSENDAPDAFTADQLFVVFIVADGGTDLEHFEFRSIAELQSVMAQASLVLAVAEEACEFEHRDLHWGNILVRRSGTSSISSRLRGVDIVVECAGVVVTLIDFTLSRLRLVTGEVACCNLSLDPELFTGPKGDSQADTYRAMRKLVKGDWQSYSPATNCLWIRYLADICLGKKMGFAHTGTDKLELRNFRKRALGYSSASALIHDEWLAGCWLANSQ